MLVQDSNPKTRGATLHSLSGAEFLKRFRWLVFHSWNIPAIFGLGFILLIGILTPAQLLGIMITPLEPAYIIVWLLFIMWFLPRKIQPVTDWLNNKPGSSHEKAYNAVKRFPLIYWAAFITYLILAPFSVVAAAHVYTDFVATPLALFRIELVALIVSIIVGLPIFFLMFDLFGKALGGLELKQPIVTIRTKVFLIGALVPLLIDTMLVQYYWTRTGFFNSETFGVWLLLEALAIGGSLIFAHSFGNSLSPLQRLIGAPRPLPDYSIHALRPQSTDELGLLTADYRELLEELHLRNEILEANNRLLRTIETETDSGAIYLTAVNLLNEAIGADVAYLAIYDRPSNTLLGVAQTDAEYLPEGHFRLKPEDQSLISWVFTHEQTAIVEDAANDPRINPELRIRTGIQSCLATPLKMGKEVKGVLMAGFTTCTCKFAARETAIIEGFGREVVLAIDAHRQRLARQQAEENLRTSQNRLRRQQDALVGLSNHQANASADIAEVLKAVTKTVATTLQVERASVWQYSAGKHELECFDLFEPEKNNHTSGIRLEEASFPNYFKALRENRVISASDAHVAPETREFSKIYLAPLGIGAMLDAPIHRAGSAIGVLCCEHVGGAREWTTDEQNFASAVADFVSLCMELNEHHKTAEDLRHHRERLEELVAERTVQLEVTNRELEAFSYSVSHDLRAPLRAVDGFARAISEEYADKLDEQGLDYLRRVCNGTTRMGNLIDDLLQLSRINRAAFNPTSLNLSGMARAITAQLADATPARDATVNISPDLTGFGDSGLLNIVLTNLLDNAWKYTSKNSSTKIDFGALSQNGQTVYFVRDNGTGFDMQYAGKLFGAFQRLHGAEFPGTGIGLATVKRIIHRHRGQVWAESELGKGATFFFTLGVAGS